MLETRESREIRDFYFKEIQENMHDFEYQWRDDERNGKGMPITCKENLTYKRNQPWKRDAGNKPVENRLGSSFRDKLLIYQTEGKIYECNQAVKSTNSSFEACLLFPLYLLYGKSSLKEELIAWCQCDQTLQEKFPLLRNMQDPYGQLLVDSLGNGFTGYETAVCLMLIDISPIHVNQQLQPKKNSDTGEVFQTVMLGRSERHEIKHFYLREIQENMYDFESQQRDDERNYKLTRKPTVVPQFHHFTVTRYVVLKNAMNMAKFQIIGPSSLDIRIFILERNNTNQWLVTEIITRLSPPVSKTPGFVPEPLELTRVVIQPHPATWLNEKQKGKTVRKRSGMELAPHSYHLETHVPNH
eukprot:bmy_15900T0